jgi:hypothetical protein
MLVLERVEEVVEARKKTILEAVRDNIGVLTFMIPALKEVVGQQSLHSERFGSLELTEGNLL